MGRSMGMGFGLPMPGGSSRACKRKFRWLFNIDGVSGSGAGGVQALPPSRSERPGLTFRETTVQHMNETVYYPAKPDWKPIQLVLYDVKMGEHPVFEWLAEAYDPRSGRWAPPVGSRFMKDAYLELYDGCGNTVESWVWESAWPQQVEFGELDMGNHELVLCTVTLRYARAYVQSA